MPGTAWRSRSPSWRHHARHSDSTTATATATQCLAIAKVPIGARVLAENPRPEEFDDSFAEPVQTEWARVSFLIVRNDLSVVEAEFIRLRAWIESLGLVKGARLDLAVPELEIDGLAEVTAVRDCPPIAEGEGRVVTGKFVTRDVANVVRITLANGTEIRATDVHPVWSVDQEDWVPAGKLEPGEQVDTLAGPVAVESVEPLDRHPAVYNLEVHGEHVYRIAVDGVLVHNGTLACHALGQAGESAADIVKNTYHIPSLSGKALFRIPDELSKTTLREVKNVAYQHFSTQLQDMLHFSMETGREMTLVVRRSTVLSNDLLAAIRAGWINLEHLP